MLKNLERVNKVTNFVVNHFKDYVEPMGYKAFLVAVDREACALYKNELDKILPKEYSEVVYSPFHGDEEELKKYHLTQEKEKIIRKAFRSPDKEPKILIVTEKLLTGFDAPILYCMYLDKPMRDHVLLQAIARVNRPYEDEYGRKKPSGFVLDFVGIFDKLEKALSYDSGDISGVIKDIEVLKQRFHEIMKKAKIDYLSLTKGNSKDKAIESVLEHFRNDNLRQEFYIFFNEMSSIYEILSPDPFLRQYIDDFDTLARMFKILKEAYESGITIDREFTRKTAKLVQEHTKSGQIKSTLDIYEINEKTIKKLEEDTASDTEKIFNLLISVKITINKGLSSSPYLHSIGEKAELISLQYKQRQIDTHDALEKIKILINEINEAKREQIQKNMPADIFSTYWILKNEQIEDAEEKAKSMKNIFELYPHWRKSEEHERKFKKEIIKVFTSSKLNVRNAVELTNKILSILKEVKE